MKLGRMFAVMLTSVMLGTILELATGGGGIAAAAVFSVGFYEWIVLSKT